MRRRARLQAAWAIAAALAARGGSLQAATVADTFRYERQASVEAGPQSLRVDLPLLVGSTPFRVEVWPVPREAARRVARGGLCDLRFYDAQGAEVPYLLVEPAAGQRVWRRAATLLPIPATKKESGFEADLGAAATIDRLRLEGLPTPFLKRLALDGSGDRRNWTRLNSAATLFDLPDSGLRQLELAFPPGSFRYLRVTWDDTSSARVPVPAKLEAREKEQAAPTRDTLSVPVSFGRRVSEPGTSRFTLRLPGPSLPIVALRLVVGGGNLSRRARVAEARLAGDAAAPARLGEALLKRALRDALAAEELRIPLEPPATAQLELEVDDGDNPPLQLQAVEAELAELPFIYLEPPERGTLTARWGQPRLAAPRYDLESARRQAAKSTPPGATWSDAQARSLEPAALAASAVLPSAGPPLDTAPFHYSRTLSQGPPGLVAVPLDAAVLAHSAGRLGGDFADLRVVDAAGRQLPYLLDRRPEPLVVALAPAVPASAPPALRLAAGTSVYRVSLPYAGLPPSRLVLRTSGRVFEREVSVWVEPAADDRRGRYGPRTVASATWRHAEPDSAAPALTLSLPTLPMAELLLAVADGDNNPLALAAPELLLPSVHLRLFRPAPAELRVVYGKSSVAPPRYDLALLATTVLTSPASEATLSAEQAEERAPSVVLRPGVFWALMLAAVAVMLVLIARLVRGAEASRE